MNTNLCGSSFHNSKNRNEGVYSLNAHQQQIEKYTCYIMECDMEIKMGTL